MRLQGKTAIVTGGSRGIGRACVVQLAAEGASVAFIYNSNQAAADALAAELSAQGRQVRAVQADVRDAGRAKKIVDDLASRVAADRHPGQFGGNRQGRADRRHDRRAVARRAGHQPRRHVQLLPRGEPAHDDAAQRQHREPFQHRGRVRLAGQVNYAASKGGINSLTRAWPRSSPGARSASTRSRRA